MDRVSERVVNRRFFYGWVIVFIAFLDSMITAGIGGYGLSFFVVPMSLDLGVSRAEFSSITLFRLVALPFIPLLGILVDKKHGPRLMLTIGSIVAGLTLVATSRVQTLWQFFLLYGVVFSVAQFSMGGQLIGPAVLAKWFVKRRGRVMAVAAMGISGGGFMVAPLAGWVVGHFDWRTGWVVLGVLIMVTLAPLGGLFMRRQPEDIGLLPDGDSPSQPGAGHGGGSAGWVDTEYQWTVRQAASTRAFWVFMACQTLGGMALMPILFHQVAYIQDKGFSLGTATSIATTLAFFAILGKLVWGLVSEHVRVRWVVPMSLVPAGLSMFLLIYGQSVQLLYAYAFLFGITMGGWAALMNVAWPDYFGRKHMGAIRGIVAPVGNVVGAISPVVAGWVWDRAGSYDLPFTVFAVCWMLAGLVVLLARPPLPPEPARVA